MRRDLFADGQNGVFLTDVALPGLLARDRLGSVAVPPTDRRTRAAKLRTTNTTGIAGVSAVLGIDGSARG